MSALRHHPRANPVRPKRSDPLPLTAAPHGQRLIITAIEAGYSGLRLRELGLAVGRSIEIICGRDPMICGVERARFALARRLASAIRVRLAAAYREA